MKAIIGVVVVLGALVVAIKFVGPVNNLARTHLPESVLSIIGEKPKGFVERSVDTVGEGLEDMGNAVKDVFK